jgi:hypothetical protein
MMTVVVLILVFITGFWWGHDFGKVSEMKSRLAQDKAAWERRE